MLVIILMSNAVNTTQYKSIIYPRLTIQSLLLIIYVIYNNVFIKSLENGIGLYNGLFNISTLTQSFNMFILLLTALILVLSAFYPRNVYSSNYSDANILNINYYNPFNMNSIKSNTYNNINLSSIKISLNKFITQFTIIEYALIIIFILCGATFLMSTGDLVSLFLSIELQSYGLYILATLYRNSESATNSGLMYFLLGGLSSCFILFGSAILYVNSGTTNLDNLYIINSINDITTNNTSYNMNWLYTSFNFDFDSNYMNISLVILGVGLLFKISSAPFHFWSPDVYDGIPTHITTFVAIIAKISLFIILLEIVSYTNIEEVFNNNSVSSSNMSYSKNNWKDILIFSSLMSLVVGSVLGLTQYRIKRLFAYSTISHVGFILLALSVNKIESIQGYIFYILQYSISNLNIFLILIIIGYSLFGHIYKNNNKFKLIDGENSPIQLLEQIKGYFHFNSYLAVSFAITLFSFVGIPPLIGFFAKQMVLSAALDEGYVFMSLIAIITSVIGAGYYLNLINLIFFNSNNYVSSDVAYRITDDLEYTKSGKGKTINSRLFLAINNPLSVIVAILTLSIALFIFVPNEWFRIMSISSISSYKL